MTLRPKATSPESTPRQDWAELASIEHRVNVNTLEHEPAASLAMNEIGLVRIETARPLVFDSYLKNRMTGSFILVDPATNATVAAGLISTAAQNGTAGTRREFSWSIVNGELIIAAPGRFSVRPNANTSGHITGEQTTVLRRLLEGLGIASANSSGENE